MDHLLFSYYFVTFSAGLFLMGVSAAAYIKSKEMTLVCHLTIFLIFSLIIFAETALSYMHANSKAPTPMVHAFASMVSLGIYLMHVALPAIFHGVSRHPQRKQRDLLFLFVALLIYSVSTIVDGTEMMTLKNVESLTLVFVMFYCLCFGLRQMKRLVESEKKLLLKKGGVILSCTLPIALCDILFSKETSMVLTGKTFLLEIGADMHLIPLIYLVFCLISTHHLISHYLLRPDAAVAAPAQAFAKTPAQEETGGLDEPEKDKGLIGGDQADPIHTSKTLDELCARRQVSQREKEVLTLVLQGQSNAQIAELLFITVGTVKSHVGSLFQKFNAASRYQLMNDLRHMAPPFARRAQETIPS